MQCWETFIGQDFYRLALTNGVISVVSTLAFETALKLVYHCNRWSHPHYHHQRHSTLIAHHHYTTLITSPSPRYPHHLTITMLPSSPHYHHATLITSPYHATLITSPSPHYLHHLTITMLMLQGGSKADLS